MVAERRQILRFLCSHLATKPRRSQVIRDHLYSLAKASAWDACEVYRSFQQDLSSVIDGLHRAYLGAFQHRGIVRIVTVRVAYGSLHLLAHCASVGRDVVLTTKIVYAKRRNVEVSKETTEEGY